MNEWTVGYSTSKSHQVHGIQNAWMSGKAIRCRRYSRRNTDISIQLWYISSAVRRPRWKWMVFTPLLFAWEIEREIWCWIYDRNNNIIIGFGGKFPKSPCKLFYSIWAKTLDFFYAGNKFYTMREENITIGESCYGVVIWSSEFRVLSGEHVVPYARISRYSKLCCPICARVNIFSKYFEVPFVEEPEPIVTWLNGRM